MNNFTYLIFFMIYICAEYKVILYRSKMRGRRSVILPVLSGDQAGFRMARHYDADARDPAEALWAKSEDMVGEKFS
ncbi:hypothetical protein [Komagataeibacter sp. NFXK3]